MKRIQKTLLSLLAVLVLFAIIRIPAHASSYLWQTGETETSVTVKWVAPSYGTVTSYSLITKEGYANNSISTSATSATIKLPKNYSGTVTLNYSYRSSYGYSYTSSYSTSINTKPTAPSKSSFGPYGGSLTSQNVYFYVKKPTGVTGAILELYKGNKKVDTDTFYSYSNSLHFSLNAIYKYRIRYYTANYSNGTRYIQSNWSAFRYFCVPKGKMTISYNKKGGKLTIYKAKNITKYTIYISKTSRDSGYKKYKTIKLGSKKKKTIKISKKYQKKAYNYVKVLPYIKGHGYSDLSLIESGYFYK